MRLYLWMDEHGDYIYAFHFEDLQNQVTDGTIHKRLGLGWIEVQRDLTGETGYVAWDEEKVIWCTALEDTKWFYGYSAEIKVEIMDLEGLLNLPTRADDEAFAAHLKEEEAFWGPPSDCYPSQ